MRRNPSVSDSTYKQIVSLTPSKSREELYAEYLEERDKFIHAESGDTKITTDIPSIPDFISSYDTEKVNSLLSQTIERPELNEREMHLLHLVESGKSLDLQATALEFNNPEIVVCPKCFQTISQSYKKNLIESIQKVLSRTVEDHQERLSESLLPPLELDFSPFEKLPSYQTGLNIVKTINQIIENNNSLIQAKINNPFSPINEGLIELTPILAELQNCRRQLESERREYNKSVSDVNGIRKHLRTIIDEIAYWDIIELVEQYDKQVSEKEIAEKTYHDAVSVCTELQRQISELQSQLANIHIAIDLINKGLKYIFFSENRMLITVEDGSYRLYSNGRLVKPKDVSVGERNIIGLCYFFARILEGKKHETAYGEEYLLIIDDPVSSFDLENRIGILSFLKYQLGLFLMGNADTRALVLTHDLMTVFDVAKIYEELMKACNKRFNGHCITEYFLNELINTQVKDFRYKKRNEYTMLMQLVYDYAQGNANEHEIYIGNIIRQVLEGFSTFEFKQKIDTVSTDDDILAAIDIDLQDYFKYLMYRLVLNGGSHREDQARNMQVDFFSVISESEKRRTAKEVLCFMRLLNAPHVKAHLGANAMTDIDTWCEEIRNRITSAP